MTISATPERSTLSLPNARLRPDDGATVRAGPNGIVSSQQQQQRPGLPPVSVQTSGSADLGALRAATSGLDRANSVTDVALAVADTVVGLLRTTREAVAGGRLTEAATALNDVETAIGAAGFDGVNLLNGSVAGGFRVPALGDGDFSVAAHDLRPGGPVVNIEVHTDPATALSQAEASLAKAEGARGALQEDSNRLGAHRAFVALLSEAVSGGGKGSLDVEGARLAALQIKQTLGGTTLALSAAAPQSVLALFR